MDTLKENPNFTFSRRIFSLGPVSRTMSRILSYAFFIILLGTVVSFLISDVARLRWAGAFLALVVLNYVVHYKSSHFTLGELFSGKVPKNNVALCLNRESNHYLLSAFEKSQITGGDLHLLVLDSMLDKERVSRSLLKLDINSAEFKNKVEEEITKSAVGSKPKKEDLLSKIKNITLIAAQIGKFHNKSEIDVECLFAAIFATDNPTVKRIADLFSVSFQDINSAIVFSGFGKRSFLPGITGGFSFKMARIRSGRINRSFTSRPTPNLDHFSIDLTEAVRRGASGFLVGHDDIYDRMVDILSSVGKHNTLLVGEPGIGKDAMVQHLAFQIVNDQVPGPLFDRRLVQLSLGDLISGASTEELTARLNLVIGEIIRAGNIILYIPEIHLLAKTSQGKGFDLSDIFSPIIQSSSFPIIGSTFPKEYKEFVEPRTDFINAFETIRVDELTQDEAVLLLTYDSILWERKYGIGINFSAIKQAVLLGTKYLHFQPLPESARNILKETLADASQKGVKIIRGDDVVAIVERKVSVPIHKTGKEEAQTLLNLETTIHKTFIDQDEAVKDVSDALRAYRSGLSRKGGPIASFLFVGPTGVGKTELSKILASIQFGSESAMVRFDMSEYQQKETISRFIGSPDGKIAGGLTEAIIQKPYSLILLDEFEKAHPDILTLFLQVFDDGRLTDSLGRTVDFQNTIIIATSNAQSVFIQDQIRAGKKIDEFSDELKKKLSEFFRPELLNRFSDVIIFKPLSLEDIQKVAYFNLLKLAQTLKESQGVDMEFSQEAIAKIAKLGYDPLFGARPLRKAIDDNLKAALSQKILSGSLSHGQKVAVGLDSSGKFIFDIS